MENGPAILGIPTKKPHPKTLASRGGKVDEDGVWYSIIEDQDSLEAYKLEVKHLVYSTIANHINVKRALREQVEQRLESLTRDVAALKEQLDHLEGKLDAMSRAWQTADVAQNDGGRSLPSDPRGDDSYRVVGQVPGVRACSR